MTSDVIARLTSALAALPQSALATPQADRVGAALVIVEPRADGETTIVYTRRRDDLRSHPGQISFPGGRVDPGETVEQAAVREANEEVGLDPAGVHLLGRLPAFYIPPSRFWLQAVVADWHEPHSLKAAEAEVAAVLHVPLSRLTDPESWRVVRLSVAGWSWAWDLGDDHLLWGATAILTTVLLGLIDPDWSRGAQPQDFVDRQVRPWEQDRPVVDRRREPRLAGLSEVAAESVAAQPRSVTKERIDRAGAAVADAAVALGSAGRVVVLVGSGGTGAVGREAAAVLTARGVQVEVVDAAAFVSGSLPPAAVIVDALVGMGLRAPLAGGPARVLEALRMTSTPVLAVDIPSGLHPREGLVGDAVSADVTIALGEVPAGLLLPGLAPFIGDLYVATLNGGGPALARVVATGPATPWRE